MFGDSITEDGHWDTLLNRTDVVNSGFSGYTTGQLMAILDSVVIKHQPKICFFMGGINDISMGVPSDHIFENYKEIMARLRSNKIIPVMQSTLNVRFMDDLNRRVNSLNEKLRKFAEREQIEYIDLNIYLIENGNLKGEFTSDGVHLTRQAYEPWANQVLNVLSKYAI